MRSRNLYPAIALLLIIAAMFVAYLPAIHGGLLWDDNDNITKPELRDWDGLARIWGQLGATQTYYPLLYTAYWVEFQLWGDALWPYHLVTLLFHSAAVVLLYCIVRRLEIPGALLAAAIFALHPVMVESVGWITEQKNTLSEAFYLGAMLVYLHFDQTRKRSQYAAALILFMLAIASKPVTATLPAALLVIFWWKRGSLSWRRDVWPLLPWFVLAAAAGLFTSWAERTIVGAQGADFALTLPQRCLIAGSVPWFYVSKLLWPANLIFMYPRWNVDPAVWWQWLFPLASVALLFALWYLRHRWRGPLAAWLLFVGTLFPVLGFLNVYWFVFSYAADHLQYQASLALIVPAAAGIELAIARLRPSAQPLGNAACVVLLGVLSVLTWQQTHFYSDVATLYETTIARNPACWMPHLNLAIILNREGNSDGALEHYQAAIAIKPTCLQAQNNLGNLLARLGRQQEAEEHLEAAARIDPNSATIQYNLGLTLDELGKYEAAAEHYRRAIELDPVYDKVYFALAKLLARRGARDEALVCAATGLEIARSLGHEALAKQIEAWLAKMAH